MKLFLTGVKREWQRILQQPTYWSALFILPLISFVAVIAVISTPHVNDVAMDVIDLDRSPASRDLIFNIDASSSVNIESISADELSALNRVKTHKSFGYLLIPKDFERALATGETVEVKAFVNQQSFMLGNILSSQVLGNLIRSSLQESTVQLMTGGQMQEQAFANVYPVSPVRSILGNSYLNYQTFLLAALLPHLWHVIVVMVTAIALGKEFKDGTIGQWYTSHNQRLSLALTSKLVIPAVILGLWIAVVDVFIFFQSNIGPYGSLHSLIIASWITQFSYHCAGLLIVALTNNYRLSLSMAAFYTTPAFAFIGVTFPTFNMNWFSQLWQSFLPITVLIQVQNEILHWQKGLLDVWPELSLVAIYALIFGTLGLVILRPKILNQEKWFKH